MIRELPKEYIITPVEYMEAVKKTKPIDLKIVDVEEYGSRINITYIVKSEINVKDTPVTSKTLYYLYDVLKHRSFDLTGGQDKEFSYFPCQITENGQDVFIIKKGMDIFPIVANALKEKGHKINDGVSLTVDDLKEILTGYEFKGSVEEDNNGHIKILMCPPQNKECVGVGACGGVEQ